MSILYSTSHLINKCIFQVFWSFLVVFQGFKLSVTLKLEILGLQEEKALSHLNLFWFDVQIAELNHNVLLHLPVFVLIVQIVEPARVLPIDWIQLIFYD